MVACLPDRTARGLCPPAGLIHRNSSFREVAAGGSAGEFCFPKGGEKCFPFISRLLLRYSNESLNTRTLCYLLLCLLV